MDIELSKGLICYEQDDRRSASNIYADVEIEAIVKNGKAYVIKKID